MTETLLTPIKLPLTGPAVLACGADTANRVCITRGAEAFLGDAAGDLSEYAAYRVFQAQIDRLTQFAGVSPQIVAHDAHPDYLSTRYAVKATAATKVAVQHHHAHVAACMVEHLLSDKVIGVALDGTGYGPDGTVWGGEFLVADLKQFQRVAHFKQYRMPGGEQAILNPARMALSCLWSELPAQVDELAESLLPGISRTDREVLLQMLEKGTRSPLTSSAGRLFDAVSAMVGICNAASYQGQAAIRLQAQARPGVTERYDFEILEPQGDNRRDCSRKDAKTQSLPRDPAILSFGPMFRRIADDMLGKIDIAAISAKFHNTLAEGIADMCGVIRSSSGIEKVALSGGVFQNAILAGLLADRLRTRSFHVYINDSLPRGDAGLAVGQAAVALAQARQ